MNRSIYVNGTTNSLTIGNLLQYAEYKFYVAACGRYRMNCGPWSDPVKAVIPGALDTQNIGCLSQMRVWRIVLALILLIVTGTLVVRKLRKKALKRKLIRARLSNFNDGNEMILNPSVAVNDQAELLHYENKYEFPRSLLKLGDILESGTFNVVRKGQAKTIRSHEAVTTVAVKTVRATASLDCKTALLRELRILCYIGNHLNLVNLLGACTKNLQYSQICVIVEFCRFGNIRDYLLRHRRDFVDQLGSDTGEIRDRNPLVDTIDANDRGSENKSQCNDNEDAEGCSDNNDLKCTSVGVDVVTEAQLAEPKLPFKYPGDYTETVTDPIRTQDLVCWAWQISRGMQYLSAKKVLHGDLAARNILLSDNNVVKICDFGLSKSLREEQNFANNERGPLPVKWMAIESLRDRVFSTKSDVWSYGVVLWELFSLADTPYHGIRPENMYQTLIEGYRMERPKYAPQILYDMMLHCWKEEPSERPSFESLIWKISEMVDEHVKLYYLDLGNSYTEMYADAWRRERETVIKGEESVSHDETQL
ncbi:vascular endothelial growth factor receptor 1-like isoform X2 [Neodiprion pinetum]|nr:vascular endothelial growth factor receptor 1-like isoform X2 [Neodiprion pinetum]